MALAGEGVTLTIVARGKVTLGAIAEEFRNACWCHSDEHGYGYRERSAA